MNHLSPADKAPIIAAWELLADMWQGKLTQADPTTPEPYLNTCRANLKEAVGEMGKLKQS